MAQITTRFWGLPKGVKKKVTKSDGTVVTERDNGQKTTDFRNRDITESLPKPTVATKNKPFVPRGAVDTSNVSAQENTYIWTRIPWITEALDTSDVSDKKQNIPEVKTWFDDKGDIDLRVTKIAEVLSDEEQRNLIDKERDRIRSLENISFEERNKMFRKLNDDIQSGAFFWGETQLEKERMRAEQAESKIRAGAKDAISDAEEIFRREIEAETRAIEEKWQRVMDTTQRLNSLRGAWRSSANEETIQKQQGQINDLIDTARQKASQALRLKRMEIEWAEADAIAAVREWLINTEKLLNERIAEAQQTQLELNSQIALQSEESMKTILDVMEAGWEDVSWISEEKSKKLGYFVNNDGSIYLNNAGNPVEFKTSPISETYSPWEIDAFAKWISNGTLKFSDLKLDNTDVALVINAMNTKMDDVPWLSVNGIKAKRILKDMELWDDDESVRTVTNLLKSYTESEVKQMIATDEFKNGAFVAWNQKLFDDLRKDAISFKDIERTYKGINDIWDNFKNNPSESRAAMEQALIIMFNKMLDPWSVVREWEFDRTSQWQSVLNAASGWLQKLESGGAGIKNEAFEDIVNIVDTLYGASKDTVRDLKSSYKNFANDLWADPDFVDRFFETGFDLWAEFNPESSVDDIYKTLTWSSGWNNSTISKKSSFEEKASFLDWDFNSGDQTSSSKESVWSLIWKMPSTINTDLVRKYPNEAAFKNNNPTGITFWISKRSQKLLDDAWVKYRKWTPRPKREWWNYYAFDTVEDGMKAYEILLTQASYQDVNKRLQQWVWTSEWPRYAANLMRKAWIPNGATFSSLTPSQLQNLMKFQLQKESPNFYKEVIA